MQSELTIVTTVKEKKGIPTVIEWEGRRYVYDPSKKG